MAIVPALDAECRPRMVQEALSETWRAIRLMDEEQAVSKTVCQVRVRSNIRKSLWQRSKLPAASKARATS